MEVTEAERQDRYVQYSGIEVTLDGYPARIVGFALRFARVVTWGAKSPRLTSEWAWETVAAVVAHGGAFKM